MENPEEKTPQVHVGNRLKQYRIEENLKPVEVAKMLGVTRQHYAIFEKNAEMKFSMILKVCSTLGLPLSYFLVDSGYEHLSAESDEQIIEYRTKLMKVEKILKNLLDDL